VEKKTELKAAQRLSHFIGAMANLGPKRTGLDNLVVWASKKEPRHACRIKVSNIRGKYSATDNFSIRLHDGKIDGTRKVSDSELSDVQKWIALNREAILKFWEDDEYDAGDFIEDLKKI
jgi:hypothetical protein